MAPDAGIALGNLSSVGRVRERNEDYFGYFAPPEADVLARKGRLFVVADGMGGESAGDVASRLAVDTVRQAYFADPAEDPTAALRASLQTANRAIYDRARTEPEGTRMGTTCTALVLRDDVAHVAHVGDTRAYLIRAGAMTRLTSDHSLAESGRANVLTRALGINAAVNVDVLEPPLPVSKDDLFLLCSDGLWGLIEDPELLRMVMAKSDLQAACRDLVALANERGGRDNITVQLIRIDVGAERVEAGPAQRPGLLAVVRRLLGAA
jgi:serine/threonine protein phosphatase PrpC